MSEIRRTVRNRQEPAVAGEGDTFVFPADLVPDGLESGNKVKIIVEGTFNRTDEGGIVQIDKIYPEKAYQKSDPLQSSIERGIDIELNIK